jgi:hypothetical protein
MTLDPTLATAERIVGLLERRGTSAVLIGAVALAARGYPRSTEDVDLAVGVDPRELHAIAEELGAAGMSVDESPPDANDPLGGVLRIEGPGTDRVEIVNFCNPPTGGFPALIELALGEAEPFAEGTTLRVATVPHLVLFKLYAGGPKSKADALELLSRNPEVSLEGVMQLCRRFRLDRRFAAWLAELGAESDG